MVSAIDLQRADGISDCVDTDVMQSLPTVANKHGASSTEMAEYLKSYLAHKEQNILSLSELGAFEKFMIHKVHENSAARVPLTDATPNAGKGKRSGNFDTPGENKAMKVEGDDGKSVVTPAGAGAAVTPATKKVATIPWAKRTGKNEMTKQVNESLGVRGDFEASDQRPIGLRCKIKDDKEDFFNVPERYRYMFTPTDERAKNLERHLVNMQKVMVEKAQIDPADVVPVGTVSPDTVWICGRVFCDTAEGKINKHSVVLEGSRRDSGGRRVKLNLDEIHALAIFPGQIIMVQGIFAHADQKFAVKRVLEGFPLEQPKSTPKQLLDYHHSTRYQGGKALSVMTAAGPFTEATNLDFEPLTDLLSKLLNEKPDVLVLLGPFVDSSQDCVSRGDTEIAEEDGSGSSAPSYDVVFAKQVISNGINAIFRAAEEGGEPLHTHIVMVPSLLDAHHECVYPQPPFGSRNKEQRIKVPWQEEEIGFLNIDNSEDSDPAKRVHLMPNPCMFRVNEVLFGCTTNDILFNLTQDKVMEKVGSPIERNIGHLLQQHSFSPQFPAPPSALAQQDLRHMKHWTMQRSPDVLLLPSKLGTNGNISTVLDTLVVNPGALVKGQTNGGTYSEMHIHPMKEDALRDQLAQGVASGENEGVPVKHEVAKRTHVKIIKI